MGIFQVELLVIELLLVISIVAIIVQRLRLPFIGLDVNIPRLTESLEPII